MMDQKYKKKKCFLNITSTIFKEKTKCEAISVARVNLEQFF